MRHKLFAVLAFAVIVASPRLLSADDNYKVIGSPDAFYFGHISLVEAKAEGQGVKVWREGQASPEDAVLNLPIGPGDTIRTPADARCEIQFDTGTIVRLDLDTELKIETVLARSLSSAAQISNLVLNRGRIYVMYKEYGSHETFQVLTANAAVKMKHNTVALIKAGSDGSTDTQVKNGKASLLYGPDPSSLRKQDVEKMKRMVVLKDNQSQLATYVADSDFELWNEDINARFEELHKGQNILPKPVQKLPKAVFYFAQNYGNAYGEWLWDDMYGYVWRPFLNQNIYPWGWQPYFYGRWSMFGGQLYWVPDEPWGWIPYHLGIWQWDEKLGWVWMPGSLFSPAWVDWEFFYGYASWRPWSLFDWYDQWLYGYQGSPFFYMDGSWYYYFPGYPTAGSPGLDGSPVLTQINKNQLKDPTRTSLTMSGKQLKSAYDRFVAAYKHNDPRVLNSLKQAPNHLVMVPKADLRAPRLQDKASRWDAVAKTQNIPPARQDPKTVVRPVNPAREAVRIFRMGESAPAKPAATARAAAGPSAPPAPKAGVVTPVPAGAPFRSNAPVARVQSPAVSRTIESLKSQGRQSFRDWNPDVRLARELGVRIEYSSSRTEVRCPELRISSSDRVRSDGPRAVMTSGGVSYAGGSYEGGSSMGSGSSTGSSSGQTSSRPASSSRESGGSKGGSTEGGGKIKN